MLVSRKDPPGPLSPILFFPLPIASLHEALEKVVKISITRAASDTNIMRLDGQRKRDLPYT
jgi:hypothetical protein